MTLTIKPSTCVATAVRSTWSYCGARSNRFFSLT
ncbi:hypothetical protein R69927_00740 [Paraburkholderia domus]|uniref:Uncharacterized protein n=1 Tax=Paraburkholderia domus TaxID=2793075 RepID=A0A9N8MKN7_9BURK|nr:hypothetical protein R70006_02571 [Paraburkholderia domus]CAE6823103.1 hypothetical protein R69927_00740 [Paraburkholderia domus]CAE6834093.1 hypothetical protein R75483_06833 [Paraburkholderia domus]CAE6859097.1 hypothetical protein R70199_00767 [Paraburkholderia domus]CAE6869600.1 hypothetical protein R70211_01108 [Paraburkholderia domus]